MNDRFVLYLDETGDRGLEQFNREYPVLCLCGCVVEDDIYREQVVPALDRLKIRWFGTTDLTLRYSAIMNKGGPYAVFRERERLYVFEQELAALIRSLPLIVIAAAIDKSQYVAQYGTTEPVNPQLPVDLYLLAADFVIERFIGCLEQEDTARGAIVAEARGKKENRLLQEHFVKRVQLGTQFYSAERFAVLEPAIAFMTKNDRVAGLELADLMAPPIATRMLLRETKSDLLWQAVKGKVWLRGDNQPGGVGFKTFPSNVGRAIMDIPLKSSEGP